MRLIRIVISYLSVSKLIGSFVLRWSSLLASPSIH